VEHKKAVKKNPQDAAYFNMSKAFDGQRDAGPD